MKEDKKDIPWDKKSCVELAARIAGDMTKENRELMILLQITNKLMSNEELYLKYRARYALKDAVDYKEMEDGVKEELDNHLAEELENDTIEEIDYNKKDEFAEDFGEDD